MTATNIALITGANRGLGLATAHQLADQGYQVWLGGRDLAACELAAQELRAAGHDAHALELDVADPASITQAASTLALAVDHLDVLVNNAGILPDESTGNKPLSGVATDTIQSALDTNAYGPLRVARAMLPLLRKGAHPRIVNVSSGMGEIATLDAMYPAYRLSKLLLNGITIMLAKELAERNIKVNAVCPGWVKTDMGGKNASRELPEGAASIVWAATLPPEGPTGGFFRDGQAIGW